MACGPAAARGGADGVRRRVYRAADDLDGVVSGGGGILLLQEIDRVTDVGLSFCAGEYYMCTAYGEENEIPDPLDTAESPYDWSVLESMPSIRWPVEED